MYFPKKSALALAVAATFSSGAMTAAYAGTASSTYNTYATEAATANNLSSVNSPSLGYQPNQVVASGTTFTVYIKLSGGATWKSSAATDINNTPAKVSFGGTSGTSSTVSASRDSSNHSVLAIQFSTSSSYSQQAVFSVSSLSGAINLNNASSLKTSGGKVSADFAFSNGSMSPTASYPSNPIDTATGTVAEAQQAIQTHVVGSDSSGFTSSPIKGTEEEAEINVGSKPTPLTNLIDPSTNNTTSYASLGALYFVDTSGIQLGGTGGTNSNDYELGSDTNQVTVRVSGNFLTNGQETLALENGTCNGSPINNNGHVTPTKSSSVDLTVPSGSLTATNKDVSPSTTAQPVYVCLNVTTSGVTNPTNLLTTQTKATVKVSNSASTVVDSTTSPQTLYNLTLNGSSVNLINYVPAAAAPYMTYVRVANNGSVSAPITATLKNPNGSVLSQGKIGTLAAGASKTYSAKKIESNLGVSPAADQRLQVQLTAPTNKLKAQSYLGNGNGGFTNMTSDK